MGADLTDDQGISPLLQAAQDSFGSVDVVILNASGGMESDLGEDYAMRLNRDAQVRALETAAEALPRGGRVVFVTSHQAHFIREVETMPEYEQVALSKRAGEDALTERIPMLSEKGIDFVVVSADMIEGTVTATLLNRARPGALDQRRESAGRLYTVQEFAQEIAAMVTAVVVQGDLRGRRRSAPHPGWGC